MRIRGSDIPNRPMDLTEWAYNSIKQLILNNTLPADSQIHIDQMAAQLNISRTPVREALMQLQNKGLVRIVPHVGCFVCRITREEFCEVFELRALIESYAARRAAETMTEEQLQQWVDHVNSSEAAVRRGNMREFNVLETIIHDSLIVNLHNRKILDVMDMVADIIYRERMIAMSSRDNVERSLEEHRLVVEAIVKHDPDEAAHLMEQHVRNVQARIEKVVFDTDPE